MDSSSDNYSPSDNEEDGEDADESTNADRQGPGETPHQEGRRADQAELGPRQNVRAREGSISQPRELLVQPDPVVQASKGQPSERKSGQGKSSKKQPSQPQSLELGASQPEWNWKEVKGKLSRGYRDLLNSVITDATRTHDEANVAFGSSLIGASFWTGDEKDCLFRRLQLCGPNDLRSLHQAVPMKNESEIRVYIQLLEKESRTPTTYSPVQLAFPMNNASAAFEVSAGCERALETTANTMALHVNNHDVSLQQDLFGENWLIDEESASYIDMAYDSQPVKDEPEDATGGAEEQAKSEPADQEHDVSNSSPPSESDASITLLRPSAFLQLSRSLFMNSAADPQQNWQLANPMPEPVESPAFFRGAFEDFYNLTVSITRRLVQASLFQAMSRLRAEDSSRTDWTPLAVVRTVDVRSALDVLDMKADFKEYWPKVARRCRVDVYSDSKKYKDGRQGTKIGHKLSYHEVEAELNLDARPPEEDEVVKVADEDVDDFMDDSEIFTDIEESEEDSNANSDGKAQSRSRSRKRKRALSPSSFYRSETKYLDALDHNASLDEEARLWKTLNPGAPAYIGQGHVDLPEKPGTTPDAEVSKRNWRDAAGYEAEWEHPLGTVDLGAFADVEQRGRLGRKRRKLLVDEVEKRLAAGDNTKIEVADSEEEGDIEDYGEESDEEMAEAKDENVSDEDEDVEDVEAGDNRMSGAGEDDAGD